MPSNSRNCQVMEAWKKFKSMCDGSGVPVAVLMLVGKEPECHGTPDLVKILVKKEKELAEEYLQRNGSTCEATQLVRDSVANAPGDISVRRLRTLITDAAFPSINTANRKAARRHKFKAENCPAWWRSTRIKFASPSGGKNRLRREDLETLYCSLKAHLRSSAPTSEVEDSRSDDVDTEEEIREEGDDSDVETEEEIRDDHDDSDVNTEKDIREEGDDNEERVDEIKEKNKCAKCNRVYKCSSALWYHIAMNPNHN